MIHVYEHDTNAHLKLNLVCVSNHMTQEVVHGTIPTMAYTAVGSHRDIWNVSL